MKQFFLLIALSLSLQLGFGQNWHPDYHDGRAFVKFFEGPAADFPTWEAGQDLSVYAEYPNVLALIAKYDIQSIQKPFRTPDPRLQSVREIRFGNHELTGGFLREWEAISNVEYSEAVPIMRSHYTPNDVSWLQWHLNTIGANQAWDFTKGNPNILIAIVDDALLMTHEDLASKIYTNPNEIPGNGVDDDNNGFIDDVNGWDAADNDNDPSSPGGAFGHGTHVSGIAAAATDNGTGIASIGFNVSIVPCKSKLDANVGNPNLDNTYGALDYAIAIGADAANMSFGGSFSITFASLCVVAHDSGMVLIASAGNDGQQIAKYPAGYNHVISVGATDLSDTKAGYSNFHQTIDVMAPGSQIYSCTTNNDASYGFSSGTSMSAPVVTGIVGLMLSLDSTLTPDEVEACLKAGCVNIDAQNSNYVGLMGAGRVNARNSLDCIANPVSISEVQLSKGSIEVYPQPANQQINLRANWNNAGTLSISLLDLQGKQLETLFVSLVSAGTFKQELNLPTQLPSGMYLLAIDLDGTVQYQKISIQ